jgi:hypothetical protein
MKTVKTIHKLIAKDLTVKFENSKITKTQLINKGICSKPTLDLILSGKNTSKALPIKKILDIYKELGFDSIDIKEGDKKLVIKPC